jgi:hypothetical protein
MRQKAVAGLAREKEDMSRTDIDVAKLNEAVREEAQLVQAAMDEVRKVIVGQKTLVERMMVALRWP